MTIAKLLPLVPLAWFLTCTLAHGYSNTVESVALALRRHARSMRQLHARRAATVSEAWVKELEG